MKAKYLIMKIRKLCVDIDLLYVQCIQSNRINIYIYTKHLIQLVRSTTKKDPAPLFSLSFLKNRLC